MPLPDDQELIDTMRATFKTPKSYRPVHAKGQLVKGTFTPHKDASKLSKAPIFTNASTPLIMRYSTDTGFKNLPDNGENGSRGFAIRFVLSSDGHKHYDIITNNIFGFVFKATRDDKMDDFPSKYPHAKYFNENQAPAHSYSFATEKWHGIHTYKFTNADNESRYFRWRIVPWQGVMKHSKADAAKQSRNYQFDDLEYRLTHKKPIKYRLLAQLAEESDEINVSTKVWLETNEFVEMGEIVVESLWAMDEGEPAGREQKGIIYDPVPRFIDDIDASDDPLIQVRTVVYLISGG